MESTSNTEQLKFFDYLEKSRFTYEALIKLKMQTSKRLDFHENSSKSGQNEKCYAMNFNFIDQTKMELRILEMLINYKLLMEQRRSTVHVADRAVVSEQPNQNQQDEDEQTGTALLTNDRSPRID